MKECRISCDMSGPEWSFRKMSRIHHMAHGAVFDRLGLKEVGQPVLLFVLSDAKSCGQRCTQRELGQIMNLSPSTVTISIKSLERRGLVTRQTDENDKRCNFVDITPAGEEAAGKCRQAFDRIDRAMYSGFSPEERRQAAGLFDRISANLTALIEKEQGGM